MILRSEEIFPKIEEVISKTERELRIVSAWIKGRVLRELLQNLREGVRLEVIVRLYEEKDVQITDEEVFKVIKERGGKVYLCDRLHAKFLVSDKRRAILGSANITGRGTSPSYGNLEVGIYLEGERAKELDLYFEEIKKNSQNLDDILGFLLSPTDSSYLSALILGEGVEEESLLTVGGEILVKVLKVNFYNLDFFTNPFEGNGTLEAFLPLEEFKKIFSGTEEEEWRKVYTFLYKLKARGEVRVAKLKVLGRLRGKNVQTLREPPKVGSPLMPLKDYWGGIFGGGVKVGKIYGTEITFNLPVLENFRRHFLVVGTTGSGKSFFTKKVLKALRDEELRVFVLDPHGEYGDFEVLKVDNTLLINSLEDLSELLKEFGFYHHLMGSSKDARETKDYLTKALREKGSLEEVFEGIPSRSIREGFMEFLKVLKDFYGEEVVKNQPEVVKKVREFLKGSRGVLVFDLSDILDFRSRLNLAGFIMEELFKEQRKNPRNTLLVLEEAQNFAPEVGQSESSISSFTPSLVMARKIASEGRKFNLGLWVITQRPASVSKGVLSQLNTQIMFRTVNRNDLSALSSYLESAGEEVLKKLPTLRTGECFICGISVETPLLIEVLNL